VIERTQVEIRNLRTAGILGVGEEERAAPQPLTVNLWLEIDPGESPQTDSIGDTVDYRRVRDAVIERIETSRFHLLEALAAALISDLAKEPRIIAARISVEKPGALRLADSVALTVSWRRRPVPENPSAASG